MYSLTSNLAAVGQRESAETAVPKRMHGVFTVFAQFSGQFVVVSYLIKKFLFRKRPSHMQACRDSQASNLTRCITSWIACCIFWRLPFLSVASYQKKHTHVCRECLCFIRRMIQEYQPFGSRNMHANSDA